MADFLRSIIHCVKFTNLVRVSNLLEQILDVLTAFQGLELIFDNTVLRVICGKDQVNRLRLIAIIL